MDGQNKKKKLALTPPNALMHYFIIYTYNLLHSSYIFQCYYLTIFRELPTTFQFLFNFLKKFWCQLSEDGEIVASKYLGAM